MEYDFNLNIYFYGFFNLMTHYGMTIWKSACLEILKCSKASIDML